MLPSAITNIIQGTRPGSALGNFIAEEGVRFLPQVAKIPAEDKPGVVAWLGPIPVGTQFASALGMRGWPAIILDIATDPTLYLNPFALTRLGTAGKGARALFGTVRAEKMSRAVKLLKDAGVAEAQIGKELENLIRTGARLDTRDYVNMARVLRGSANDAEALKKLSMAGRRNIEERWRGLETEPLRMEEEILPIEKTLGAQKELEAVISEERPLTAKEKATSKAVKQELRETGELVRGLVRASQEKAIPGRTSRLEIPPDPQLDRVMNALREGKLKEGVDGRGVQGITQALDLIDEAVRNRQAVRAEASQLRQVLDSGTATLKDFKTFEKRLLKLDPSVRTTTLFKQNKKAFEAFVEETLLDHPVAPLARTLEEQARLGQRALLSLRVPFTNIEMPLVQGASVFGEIEKRLGAKGGRLTLGKQAAGLVQGARAATAQMNKLLGAPRRLHDLDTLQQTMAHAAETARGLPHDTGRFKGMNEAHATETMRGQFFGGRTMAEFQNVMHNNAMDAADGFKILRMADDLPAHVNPVTGELTAKARALGMDESHRDFAAAISQSLEANRSFLKNEQLVDVFLDNYFPRLVEVLDKDKFRHWVGARTKAVSKFYKHGVPRTVELLDDLLELEKQGVVKVNKDPAVVLGHYFDATAKSAADRRALRGLFRIREPRTQTIRAATAVEAGADDALPMIARPNSQVVKFNPNAYAPITARNNPYLFDVLRSGAAEYHRVTGLVPEAMRHSGDTLMVLKDLAKPLDKIFAPRLTPSPATMRGESIFEAWLRVNALAKRGLLFWSFFHHMALTETGVVDGGVDFLKAIPSMAQGFVRAGKQEFKGLRGDSSIFDSGSLIDTATRSGLQLGALVDAEVDTFQRAMRAVERTVPSLSPATKALSKVEMVNNKTLWDFYQNALKLFTWNTLYHRALTKFPGKPALEVARGVAEHVNNSFGGHMWETLMIGREGQRWLRALLLAPDWTISNLRIAMDFWGNAIKGREMWQRGRAAIGFPVSPADLLRTDVKALYARQYALRTAVMLGIFANMANVAFRGHFMDENPEGYRDVVMLPWKDEDGRALFWRIGKQFREPYEIVKEPGDFARRKLSAVPSAVLMTLTGTDMFGGPIYTSEDGPLSRLAKTAGIGLRTMTPITIQLIFGMGRASASPLTGVAGFFGLPIKREFKPKDRAAGGNVPIDERLGDLLQEMEKSGALRRLQDQMAVGPRTGTLAR